MSIYQIDAENELYYEYIPPKHSGFTCVFVNALTGDLSTWTGNIGKSLLSNGNGYLAYNLRGQSKSKFRKNLTLDDKLIVSDLLKLVDYLKVKNIILIGLSIGGLYAAMALEKGLDAKGIVLINTLRKPSERLNWINNAMINAIKLGGTNLILDMIMPVMASPEFLKKIKDEALKYENYLGLEDYEGISKLIYGGFTTNWNFNWSNIKVPTLVMTGHYDKVFRVSKDIDEIILKIKNVVRIDVKECGHLIPLENPKLFYYHLNGFINSI